MCCVFLTCSLSLLFSPSLLLSLLSLSSLLSTPGVAAFASAPAAIRSSMHRWCPPWAANRSGVAPAFTWLTPSSAPTASNSIARHGASPLNAVRCRSSHPPPSIRVSVMLKPGSAMTEATSLCSVDRASSAFFSSAKSSSPSDAIEPGERHTTFSEPSQHTLEERSPPHVSHTTCSSIRTRGLRSGFTRLNKPSMWAFAIFF